LLSAQNTGMTSTNTDASSMEIRTQTFTDVRRDQQNYGIYAQGDFAVLTNLHVTRACATTNMASLTPTTNPRLACDLQCVAEVNLQSHLRNRLSRPPISWSLGDPRFQDIGPEEEITTYELVYEQGIGRQLRTSLSGFYTR